MLYSQFRNSGMTLFSFTLLILNLKSRTCDDQISKDDYIKRHQEYLIYQQSQSPSVHHQQFCPMPRSLSARASTTF